MRRLAALLLALAGLVAALPSSATACLAEAPTFEQVLEGSRSIVLGRVTRAINDNDHPYPDRFVIAVERTLRGPARSEVVVKQRAGLCGDGLGPDSVGQRVIIALDLRFYGQNLSPYWWQFPNGEMRGWAQTPPGISSLDELADRIAVSLLDTATDVSSPTDSQPTAWLAFVAGLAALALFLLRPLGRRRPG